MPTNNVDLFEDLTAKRRCGAGDSKLQFHECLRNTGVPRTTRTLEVKSSEIGNQFPTVILIPAPNVL